MAFKTFKFATLNPHIQMCLRAHYGSYNLGILDSIIKQFIWKKYHHYILLLHSVSSFDHILKKCSVYEFLWLYRYSKMKHSVSCIAPQRMAKVVGLYALYTLIMTSMLFKEHITDRVCYINHVFSKVFFIILYSRSSFIQLFGCTVIAIGIWIAVDPSSLLRQSSNRAFNNFIDQSDATFRYQFTGAYILIAVGVTITVIGFVGCCATLHLNRCLLGTVRPAS